MYNPQTVIVSGKNPIVIAEPMCWITKMINDMYIGPSFKDGRMILLDLGEKDVSAAEAGTC